MLTDSQIRSAKPSTRPRKLFDSRGLYLQIMPSGGRYWRFDYRFKEKRRTLALGVFPDVSLAKARARHQEARVRLADGVDPSVEKRTISKSFETVAREWYSRWKESRNERHTIYVLRRLEADVFPRIGARPVSGLAASDFRDVAERVERRGALDIARRVLQTCGQIMRYAVVNDLLTHNPVADVKPGDILKPRRKRNYPRVGPKELPELLRAMNGYVGGEHTRLALQLMALTFVRTSELIGARWSEFDFKEARWDIPSERMKMKTPHIVPLSIQASAILERLQEISFGRELVFPGDVNPRKPMSNNTLLFALYRMAVTPDVVITVCGSAAGETCPAYLGPVLRTHWGVEDPAHATGTDSQIDAAFDKAYRTLRARIEAFLALPLEQLVKDRVRLKAEMDRIGTQFA